MAFLYKFPRGTRANLASKVSGSTILVGQAYTVSDESGRLSVGTAVNAVSDMALKSEADAALARANHTGTQAISTILAAATARFFGRITAAGGAGEEMTGTQATTLLDAFTNALKGLVPAGNANKQYLRSDATWADDIRAIPFIIDGAGSVITTGLKGFIEVPFAGTLQGWTLMGDQSGSIVVDIWKDTYANFPPTIADVITASAKPTITTAQKGQSSTLTGWTTAVAAGDILAFNVNSVTTITKCTLSLKIKAD